jgi:phosphatidylglycerol:prolipoprotein diacylglycerol transferase
VVAALIWDVDREMFSVGPLIIYWYSVFFASGFFLMVFSLNKLVKSEGKDSFRMNEFLIMQIIGSLAGARLVHCLFYQPEIYLNDPIRILHLSEGGLASHGGFLGAMVFGWLYAKMKRQFSFLWLADRTCIFAPLAGFFMRIGNFFNSEILGLPTDLPWAVVFAHVDSVPRHPVQLYEALCYLSVAVILYVFYIIGKNRWPEGCIVGFCCIFVGIFRFFLEFLKEGQSSLVHQGMHLKMGQMLCIPLMLVGFFMVMDWHHTLSNRMKPEAPRSTDPNS